MILQSHVHRLIEGTNTTKPPLVLLHGSAGNEDDLVPLVADVVAGSTILAVRGNVPFDDGSAFFRRFEDRTIDEADIRERGIVLADFIKALGFTTDLPRRRLHWASRMALSWRLRCC